MAALAGARYWSFVLMHLVVVITTAIGVWVACDWRPGRWSSRVSIRAMLSFGRDVAGLEMQSYLIANVDHVLIGRAWGAAALGLYDKAYQLLMMPGSQLVIPMSPVVYTTLSRLLEDSDRYRLYLRRAIRLASGCGMPLVVFLFVTADVLIPSLFGAAWSDSVVIYRALAPAAFVNTFTVGVMWILVSRGKTRRMFRWSLLTTAVTVIVLASAVRWGPIGVALAYSACRLAYPVPTFIYCCRRTPVRWTDVPSAAASPAAAAILAGAALVAVRQWPMPAGAPLLQLLVEAALFGALYLALLTWFSGPRRMRADLDAVVAALRGNTNALASS